MKVTRGILVAEFRNILINNAPVRTYPLGAIKYSPYPGYLKNNAISIKDSGEHTQISIGGDVVPYAVFTEYTSFKKGWITESCSDFIATCKRYGGIVK